MTIGESFADFRRRIEPARQVWPGWMVDHEGTGQAIVTGEPGYVYVRLDRGDGSDGGDPVKARSRIRPVPGWPVLVGETREVDWEYNVLAVDDEAIGQSLMGVPSLEHHRVMHEFANPDGGDDWVRVKLEQIANCRVGPNEPPDLNVQIGDGLYQWGGVIYYYPGSTQDLSSYVPANYERYVTISLGDANAVDIVAGTIKSVTTTEDIPAASDSRNWRLAAVKLRQGQTTITEPPLTNHIFDLRFLNVTSSGASNLQAEIDKLRNELIALAKAFDAFQTLHSSGVG